MLNSLNRSEAVSNSRCEIVVKKRANFSAKVDKLKIRFSGKLQKQCPGLREEVNNLSSFLFELYLF